MSIKNIAFGMLIVIALFSCKSFKSEKKQEVTLVKGYKTPIVMGAGGRGKKITLNLRVKEGVELVSIEYNKLINSLNIIKESEKEISIECYFYNETKRTLTGTTKYVAEGNSCTLHYMYKDNPKILVCENLIELSDSSLWK